MQTYRDQTYEDCTTYDPEIEGFQRGLRFGPARYESCLWQSIHLIALAEWEFEDWPVLSRIELDRCRGDAHLSSVHLDRCEITSWKGTARLVDCALRETVFRGRFRSLWFDWSSSDRTASRRAMSAEFHTSVDWAIDVSEVQSPELGVRSIPAEKVRVDPSRQFFASGLSVQPGAATLSEIPLREYGLTGMVLRERLAARDPQYVIFFSLDPRSKTHAAELQLIALLHEHGLVLPTAAH